MNGGGRSECGVVPTLRRSARWASALLCLAGSAHAGLPPLQPLIDAAPVGSVLRPPPGRYAGPVVITKPLAIEGGGRVGVDGGGHGSVLTIRAPDVTVRGLHLGNSGQTHDGVDAGVLIEADFAHVENNRIDQVLFGIHLKQANHARIAGNHISSRPDEASLRGDGVRLWNSRYNRIEGNTLIATRDITVANSADNQFIGNTIRDGRFGLQLIFSPRNRIEGNRISHNSTGIAVLYSDEVTLRGNHIEHARDVAGAGLAFKDSSQILVEGNTILHCTVGAQANAPTHPANIIRFRDNRFAYNVTGLYFYGENGGHLIHGNRFEQNLVQVGVSGPRSARGNDWRGNWWDDYQGFDRNRDGIGDTPYELWYYADRIWM